MQIALEEVAEKARKTWVEICLVKANSFQAFLTDLNGEIKPIFARIQSVDPDSSFKKIRRIFAAFENDLAVQDIENGPEFGKELSNLLFKSCPSGGPENKTLRNATGIEYLGSLRKILRLNVEANQDPSIYRIADRIQKWWAPASPPENIRHEIGQIARIGGKTIFLHAKRGIQNTGLRRVLNDLAGSQKMNKLLNNFAVKDLSLDETMSHWLSSGTAIKEVQKNQAVSQLTKNNENEYFAELIILLSSPSFERGNLDLLAETVEPIFPDEAASISKLASNLGLAQQWLTSLRKKRRLELISVRGNIVKYNPKLHDTNDLIDLNLEARVEKPGVKIETTGRPSQIIRKPVVRKL